MAKLSLSRLLKHKQKKPRTEKKKLENQITELQHQMLRVQQGVWHGKGRVILAFEGFDAAGKGGCIRTLTEKLDPRSFMVHPIGPPDPEDQGRHYLYRFWKNIPKPGMIAIFDRTWYGRVLVEKVEELIAPKRVLEAYREINEFERALQDDGIEILKFFLAVSKEEQLKRFCDRLNDPFKQWKISEADIEARKQWNDYVRAVDAMLAKTSDWHLVPADHKDAARVSVLSSCTEELKHWNQWIHKKARDTGVRDLRNELLAMGREEKELR